MPARTGAYERPARAPESSERQVDPLRPDHSAPLRRDLPYLERTTAADHATGVPHDRAPRRFPDQDGHPVDDADLPDARERLDRLADRGTPEALVSSIHSPCRSQSTSADQTRPEGALTSWVTTSSATR